MNKKFFLSVFLLGALTLSSGVLTSCIDNDEPEGITTLRGAKAELLRAKAALELANAETEKQRALYVAAMAEHEKALAEVQKAEAEIKKAQAAVEAAKVAIVEAKADSLNAAAEKAWAEAESAKALAEMQIAQYKAQIDSINQRMEITRLELETDMAKAQQTLDSTLVNIEAAKAVLTGEQAAKLADLKGDVDKAWTALKTAQLNVLTQMKTAFVATNAHADQLENYQNAVINAKAKLIAINAAYDELTALANSVSITAWEARRDSINLYVGDGAAVKGSAVEEEAILELKKLEIKQSAEYKAKAAEDAAAREAYVAAQQEWNYRTNGGADKNYMTDCFKADANHDANSTNFDKYGNFGAEVSDATHPTASARSAKTYNFPEIKIEVKNSEVANKLGLTLTDGKYFYKSQKQEDVTYDKFEKAAFKTTDVFQQSKDIATWLKTIDDTKFTAEEIEKDTCKANYEKAVTDAEKAHTEMVATWKALHEQYATNGEKMIAVPTKKADDAIAAYNAALKNLNTLVDTYNTTYNTEVEKKAAELLQKEKDVAGLAAAKQEVLDNTTIATKLGVFSLTDLPMDSFEKLYNFIVAKETLLTADEFSNIKIKITTANESAWKTWSTAILESKTNSANETAYTEIESTKSDDSKPVGSAYKAVNDLKTQLNNPLNATDKKFQYAELAAGLGAYEEELFKNGQILKANTTEYATIAEGLTGVGEKKYYSAGDEVAKEPTQTVTAGLWTAQKVVKDKDGKKYENVRGNLMVVRTEIADASKVLASKYNESKAKTAWENASNAAFGTGTANARHTELTKDMVKNGKDELGNTVGASTLKTLMEAEATLAKHVAFAAGTEDLAAVKKAVEAAKSALQAQFSEIKKAIDEAYAAIAPAKKAHQVAHNAAAKLTEDVQAQIDAIDLKKTDLSDIKDKLDDIITAYYSNQNFYYTDENGEKQPANATDVEKLKDWIKVELNKYEKKDSPFTPIDTYYKASQGKIKDAEYKVSKAQKTLDRHIADEDFDGVAEAQLALEQAKQDLAVAQQNYDFALAQLNAYVAALGQ